MPLTDLPVLSVLRAKMKWHQARQSVLAENVANADTPGYRGRELKPLNFDSMVQAASPSGVKMRVTDGQHLSGSRGAAEQTDFRKDKDPDFDTTPSGNSVVLEEQMMKVAQNQMDYQAATSLYSKSVGLLRMAIGQGQR